MSSNILSCSLGARKQVAHEKSHEFRQELEKEVPAETYVTITNAFGSASCNLLREVLTACLRRVGSLWDPGTLS